MSAPKGKEFTVKNVKSTELLRCVKVNKVNQVQVNYLESCVQGNYDLSNNPDHASNWEEEFRHHQAMCETYLHGDPTDDSSNADGSDAFSDCSSKADGSNALKDCSSNADGSNASSGYYSINDVNDNSYSNAPSDASSEITELNPHFAVPSLHM